MTPFGEKLRALRAAKGISLRHMAASLQISAAYLSSLENGHRGRPSRGLVRQICEYFDLIWDDAEEIERLADISHPRVVVDTAGLDPLATEVANRLAERIGSLDKPTLEKIRGLLGD
ncbi:helix-turn-helix domain-containing protein [Lacibacterium aquatile]|uniref:Helix-turn-helix domain-containing protein n=1 Tax=Lacibacterium aquatile TaxID=1168082 RepID=A0ABW5DL70_9PROT